MITNWSNGVTRVTLTDGTQRKSKRSGISYDYMDKLNELVKKGIFIDKDKNGFTSAEQKALGEEFTKLHKERGDLTNFKKMLAGKYFDYKDEEFVRLAKAAGYIPADECSAEQKVNPQVIKPEKAEKAEEVKPAQKSEPEKVSVQEPANPQKTASQAEEHVLLNEELKKMKAGWTEDELKYPQEKLRSLMWETAAEIYELKKPYTTETVLRKRFLRKPVEEKVQKPKTEEQLAADKKKIEEKTAELEKLAKLQAVEELYSTIYPAKYAPNKGDKFLTNIITTNDGRKLGAAIVKKQVHDKELNYTYDTWVTEYYPLTLKQAPKYSDNALPSYYYTADENAKPVTGRIELTDGKVVQE